jgi:putative ABC transport system permease protein
MQIPLVQGRLFTERDNEASEQVALINRTMASQLFAGQDPVGRRVQTTFEQGRWARIVGVVGDVRQHGLASRGRPEMYRPLAQHPLATISLVIRTSVPPSSIGSLVRGTVVTINDRVPVWAVLPMRDVVGTSIAEWRFFTLLLTSFAAVALILGATGIFGVMAYDVSQRRREIGVRLALGADPRRLRRAVISDGLTLTAIGLVLGIGAAIASGRWMSGLLVGVSPADPLTLLSVAALLALVAAASSYVPARRAASVDPAVALRAE